jgi:hypothetical protein
MEESSESFWATLTLPKKKKGWAFWKLAGSACQGCSMDWVWKIGNISNGVVVRPGDEVAAGNRYFPKERELPRASFAGLCEGCWKGRAFSDYPWIFKKNYQPGSRGLGTLARFYGF